MPLIRIGNVKENLNARGIDPTTNEGNNALVAWVLEIVPNAVSIGYIPDEDILEVIDPYVQPPLLPELGEVLYIDNSVW